MWHFGPSVSHRNDRPQNLVGSIVRRLTSTPNIDRLSPFCQYIFVMLISSQESSLTLHASQSNCPTARGGPPLTPPKRSAPLPGPHTRPHVFKNTAIQSQFPKTLNTSSGTCAKLCLEATAEVSGNQSRRSDSGCGTVLTARGSLLTSMAAMRSSGEEDGLGRQSDGTGSQKRVGDSCYPSGGFMLTSAWVARP